MKIEIKSWKTGKVLFSCESESLRSAVDLAVKAGANLSGADLTGANLYRADLSEANLSWANLYGADLIWANLSGANLTWANLTGANLTGANLTGADLTGANLTGADLSGADLTWANLSGANLTGYISIGPLGSRESYLWARWEGKKYVIHTGCFYGTLEEFSEAVKKNHKAGVHRVEYLSAIELLKCRMEESKAKS